MSLAEMFGPVLHPEVQLETPRVRAARRTAPGGISRGARRGVWLLALLTVLGGAIVLTSVLRLDASFSLWSVGLSLLLVAGAGVAVLRLTPAEGAGDAAVRLVGPCHGRVRQRPRRGRRLQRLVARPVIALARLVVVLDREVVDAYVRGTVVATRWAVPGPSGRTPAGPPRAWSGSSRRARRRRRGGGLW